MRNTRGVLLCGIIVASLLCWVPTAQGTVDHGDFFGTDVNFLDVEETTNTPPFNEPLFGAPNGGNPSLPGNTLDFNPQGFSASATNGSGDITDVQLNFTIMRSKPLSIIDKIVFSERGDYTLAGVGTDATTAQVAAAVFIDITEVDGAVLDTVLEIDANMVFTPPDGNYNLEDEPGTGVQFNGYLEADLTQALIDNSIAFNQGVTKVDVVLDNTLVATSESGTIAFIAKKDFKGLSVTAVIPEPSTALLGVTAFVGLLLLGRKRSS